MPDEPFTVLRTVGTHAIPDVLVIEGDLDEARRRLAVPSADAEKWRLAYADIVGRRYRTRGRRCRAARCRNLTRWAYDFGSFRAALCDDHRPTRSESGEWVAQPGMTLKPHRAPRETPDA